MSKPVSTTELPYPRLGLKPTLLRELLAEHEGRRPWRVASVERGACGVLGLDDDGALVEGHARTNPQIPVAVGDWVLLDAGSEDGPDQGRVDAVLERTTWLRRGSVKREGEAQLLAANLDTVFIVAAFAETDKLERRALNARRLDRFVLAVREGGAVPVIVLNKVDLAGREAAELDALVEDLGVRQGGADVLWSSATEGKGLEPLRGYLAEGETVAFIGMSGVGKSSLINALLGEERQAVTDIRRLDAKGRHTTTRRELVVMPSGALLIDTPGVRELAVFLAGGDMVGFDDVDTLAASCRFSDCAHEAEPGCAVIAAIESGALSADRVASYRDLKREAERLDKRHGALARHLEKKEGKRFGKMVREAKAMKKR